MRAVPPGGCDGAMPQTSSNRSDGSSPAPVKSAASEGGRRRSAPPTRLARILKMTKWPVLLVWIVAAVVATALASHLEDVQRNDSAAYLPKGFDSSQVARLAEPDPA